MAIRLTGIDAPESKPAYGTAAASSGSNPHLACRIGCLGFSCDRHWLVVLIGAWTPCGHRGSRRSLYQDGLNLVAGIERRCLRGDPSTLQIIQFVLQHDSILAPDDVLFQRVSERVALQEDLAMLRRSGYPQKGRADSTVNRDSGSGGHAQQLRLWTYPMLYPAPGRFLNFRRSSLVDHPDFGVAVVNCLPVGDLGIGATS